MIESSDRTVGKQLGNYHLVELLGRGGFADVYLGEHIYLKTPAAIKVLREQLSSDALEQFLAEARIIARLTHPNIVRVLEFGIEQSIPFLVMSYAPYGTLRQRHPAGSILGKETILAYVEQIAAALHYAHSNKVVHRDIKPENMLVGDNSALMLSDFGIAIRSHSRESSPEQQVSQGPIVGTVAYMAPELFHDRPCPASDQYALGIVVYEWLCGATPFRGSGVQIACQHIQKLPPPLREKVPTLSLALEQVVMRALAKEPGERFATIQDFASALKDAVSMIPSPHTPLSLKPLNGDLPSGGRVSSGGLLSAYTSPTVVDFPPDRPRTEDLSHRPLILPAYPQPVSHPTLLKSQRGEPTRSPSPLPSKISRRNMLLGLGGLVGVSVAAVGTWYILGRRTPQVSSSSSPTKKATVVKPTPTPTPDPAWVTINATNTRPALASWQAEHLDMCIRGADNILWQRSYDKAWGSWKSLGSNLLYDPAVTSWSAGRLDVFARGADNALLHRWYDGEWHEWESLGGILTSNPAVASWGAGRLDVVVRSVGNGIWHKAFDGTWHEWSNLGGVLTSDPAVVTWGAGRLDIFARGTDNALWHKWYEGGWHEWHSLGGVLASDPAAASWGVGRLDVFARGADNTLMHKYFDGIWHDWLSLGGTITSSPAAISWGRNRIDVFARDVNNAILHKQYDTSWHDWEPMLSMTST
jgi:serine/threonine protein kinase